jgi:hypothetical protein
VSCGGRTVGMSTASDSRQTPHPNFATLYRHPRRDLRPTFTNVAGESSWHAKCRLDNRECQDNEIVAFCCVRTAVGVATRICSGSELARVKHSCANRWRVDEERRDSS